MDSSDRGQVPWGQAGSNWPGMKGEPAQACWPTFLASPLPLPLQVRLESISLPLRLFSLLSFLPSQLPLCHPVCIFLAPCSSSLLYFFCLSATLSLSFSVSHIFSLCHPPLPCVPSPNQASLFEQQRALFLLETKLNKIPRVSSQNLPWKKLWEDITSGRGVLGVVRAQC